ncbi:LysM peptidoglycan-binding domain-containing protein, partial [Pseudomonas gingeri]|nr:LysM peptidoglycan-binding domain-containing protein [Pseudomonas gingeri]
MSLTVIRQRMGKTSVQRLMIGLALSALLAGCSSASKNGVRVVDRNGNASSPASAAPQRPMTTTGQHVVVRGDTLFSIAFRYGWDWKALAARNNIPEPYTIHVGQAIRFDSRSNSTPAVATSTTTTSSSSSFSKTTVTRRPATAAGTPAAAPAPTAAATPTPPPGPAPKGWA